MYPYISKKGCVFCLFLLFLNECKANRRVYVNIENHLPAKVDIHWHLNGAFSRKIIFFQRTYFRCSFKWADEPKYYHIYVQKRDHNRCLECWWRIHESGPCMMDWGDRNYHCYEWDKFEMLAQNSTRDPRVQSILLSFLLTKQMN
ncbi:Plant self-incompatibility S1 [Dillenia turbinata]|uniref:Plant self-incompatibility S1 n=1 Tax=Dillenia turbinata TaxID=194707 RepID=A0AAN8U979_9MAGN